MKPLFVTMAAALLAACAGEGRPAKAIVGATLLNPGKPPVDYAVILIRGSRVEKVGTMTDVPIPAGSEKLQGYGKFVTPHSEAEPISAGATANLKVFAHDPRSNPQQPPERVLSEGEWTK
ncbi:MAG: hypothetical protein IT168_00025 [Bryobacterales bacterium]|nr:hypothetical protein [Bryobacterales bacterium]